MMKFVPFCSRNLSAPSALLLAFTCAGAALLAGCGGGGGGGGNSGGGTSTTRTHVTFTVQWPTRSKSIGAPASALSGQVTLQGAGANGGDFVFMVNRDTTRSDSYSQSYQSDAEAKLGQWQANITFFSQPNGTGSPVANATKSVNLSQSADLGDIAVTNQVASVMVDQGQKVAVGQLLRPTFVALTAQGVQVAVTPESGAANVVGGQNVASVVNGQIQGNAAGLAQVTVTVDGKTSAPVTVGVGQASLTLAASGPAGYLPYSVSQPGGTTTYLNIADIAPYTIAADWFAVATITAPDNYGDRQFVKWQFNGADISNTSTVNFSVLDKGPGTLTAVYSTRAATSGQYLPNFYQTTFKHWANFPVKVYFNAAAGADASKQPLLRQAMDFWVAAAGDRFAYQIVDTQAAADITVSFGTVPSGAHGFCDSQWDGHDQMTHADIILASELLQAGRDEDLKLAARHEFGHSLGMTGDQPGAGHSTDPNDTMYATGNPQVNVITSRDINTVTTIYPSLLGRAQKTGVPVGPTVGRAREF